MGGVELLDTQKIWCTSDGRQGRYQGGSLSKPVQQQRPSSNAKQFVPIGAVHQLLQSDRQSIGQLSRVPSSVVTQSPSQMSFGTASIEALISGRERARENHDWEAADTIRADLRAHGVDV